MWINVSSFIHSDFKSNFFHRTLKKCVKMTQILTFLLPWQPHLTRKSLPTILILFLKISRYTKRMLTEKKYDKIISLRQNQWKNRKKIPKTNNFRAHSNPLSNPNPKGFFLKTNLYYLVLNDSVHIIIQHGCITVL